MACQGQTVSWAHTRRNNLNLTFAALRENCMLKNGEDLPTLEEVLSYFSDKDFLMPTEFEDYPNARTYRLFKKYYGEHPERLKLLGVSPIFTMFRIHAKRMTSKFWRNG